MDLSVDFFVEHKRLFLTFHLLGVALGMGGATVADLLFFSFLKDFKITKKETEILGMLSNIILAGIFVLYVSGVFLFLSDIPRYSVSPAFFGKMTIVAVLTLNGILMHSYIAPRMVHLSFMEKEFHPKHVMHHLRAVAFAMGAVSFTSWYAVFFLASLKSYLPDEATHAHILGAYALILMCAVISSQIVQKVYHRRYLFSIR